MIHLFTKTLGAAALFAALLPMASAQTAGAAANTNANANANAAAWSPTKPITLIVPVPPGSSTDMLARLLAERLPATLGQTVIVTNRPGASGMIGAASVARAEPDGYTLLLSPSTLLGAPHVLPKGAGSGVDVVNDLTVIVKTASSPLVILAHPSLGVKTPRELAAYAKDHPGLPYASSGSGSPQHIAGQLFSKATRTELTHVPYKGVMPAVMDTVGGQIKLVFSALGGVTQYIDGGQLVAIAVTEKARSSLLPNVPTLTESGIPGVELNVFFPVMAPAKTPAPVLARLNREINAVMRSPDVKEKMRAAGVETLGSTVEDAQREVREEYQRYGQVVAEFNIKAD
ncbi:Bug family tripartite tricarboxylate transporter substrate binding protein [Pigmentiphaga litoralis]|uniref:Tripartite-type tricarboxylate transporter receptor subunit TctC n=1 Tax=Pigmentiphaga litoralis TaxID=516702 RepID=A0A7Y9LJR9_9BURK|nr:tripartite tricarboxylate transporter substrate binding protein [Pigmentiphaga litoralis]NYE25641.1 tripartite-type tricarboxylate transporter receptor subunit TctC [Pigmentiphaga litoralis]NYE80747.1 tripartite-type tricarboxylate transporter receptor subunit TctC [Pigmentiphaga litoralis]